MDHLSYNNRRSYNRKLTETKNMNFLHALSELVGKTNVLTGKAAAPYLVDWRERYHGQALAVVRPGTTDEVASVIRACAAAVSQR